MILAVNVSQMQIYDYLRDGETPEQLLKRAEDSNAKDIATLERHCNQYPDTLLFKNNLRNAREKAYQIMTLSEFKKAERDYYIQQPLEEITEEQFHYMLNLLPPICWTTIQGVEMFCMSEMLAGTYTNQYANVGDKRYYTKIVDIRDRSTWIHNFL